VHAVDVPVQRSQVQRRHAAARQPVHVPFLTSITYWNLPWVRSY
jgi:hypothetical protein